VLYKLIEEFSDIIVSYNVFEYKRYGSAISLVATINFPKGSSLFIKDYLFLDGKRKYSYHWQDADGSLITRWDNSPHYREVASFPHHKHLRNGIAESKERTLKDILKVIRDTIHN
jgi:hypothetical protein